MSEGAGNEEHSLRELLGKIRHPLVAVRGRSLRSIVFKLNNQLLSPADLVREREFLSALLEWFNFEEWTMEAQVLSLLEQLAQHEPAAVVLVEVGAVEFLSQLRLHCDPSLHPLIDDIIEHLLSLPGSPVEHTTDALTPQPPGADSALSKEPQSSLTPLRPESEGLGQMPVTMPAGLSQGSQQTDSTDFGSYPEVNRESFGLSGLSVASDIGKTLSSYPGVPPEYLQKTHSLSTSTQSNVSSSSPSTSASLQGSLSEHVGSRTGPTSSSGAPDWNRARKTGFPYNGSETTDSIPRDDGPNTAQAEKRPAPSTFPWLQLSVNDCHILATTESRLQSSKGDVLLRSCDFIQEVLLQDFPAEIFLQRPGILKILLQLVGEARLSDVCVQHTALLCLMELSSRLRERVVHSATPGLGHADKLVQPTQLEKVNSDPVVVGLLQPGQLLTCEGGCNQLSQEQDLEEVTEEVLAQLQSEQMTLEQFCHCVLTHIPLLLVSYLNQDFHLPSEHGHRLLPSGSTPNQISICYHLIAASIDLLKIVTDSSLTSGLGNQRKDCLSALQGAQCVDSFTSALAQCLSKWRRVQTQSTLIPGSTQCQTQLLCCTTVHLAACLASLLDASCSKVPLPAATVTVLDDIMMSGAVSVVCPELQAMLQPHFEKAEGSKSKLYQSSRQISSAFQQMSRFLAVYRENPTNQELLSLALAALPGLYISPNREFIADAMKLCMERLTGKGGERDPAKTLLLKLLSHGSAQVQTQVYQSLKGYITEGVPRLRDGEGGGDPNPGILSVILDGQILEEICSGAVSEIEAVVSPAGDLLALLLTATEELFWPELRDTLMQWLISMEASKHGRLWKALQDLLGEPQEAVGIPEVTRVQSLLRLLFSESTEVRVWGLTTTSKLLLSKCVGKGSSFLATPATALQDVMVVGRPSIHYACRRSTFEPGDVVKLLHILRSPTMEASLQRSALEQLAVILQDSALHGPAIAEGIIADLRKIFSTALQQASLSAASPGDQAGRGEEKDEEDEEEEERKKEAGEAVRLLRPCIHCLQLLSHSDSSLRKELGCDVDFLMDSFRATLLCQKDLSVLYNASKLLSCLLFTPVARFNSGEESDVVMSLPLILTKRLKFPYEVGVYTPDVSYSTPAPLDPHLVHSDPPLSMLRLCYHSILAGSFDTLLEGSYPQPEEPEMEIRTGDRVLLRALSLSSSLSDCFTGLQSAKSHELVEAQLGHLSALLQAGWRRDREMEEVLNLGRFDCKELFCRYLTVPPVTEKDTILLTAVLEFLCSLVTGSSSGGKADPVEGSQLMRLLETTTGSGAVCLQLLQSSLETVERSHSQRNLQKALLKFFACLMKRIAGKSSPPLLVPSGFLLEPQKSFDPMGLTETLCHCLDVAGCPDYYDLPLLETSLECLWHLTASCLRRRPPSAEWLTQCMKLMTSLQQVLLSFISGRGTLLASFMGKGVTSRAALSLSHLLQVTRTLNPPAPEEWWLQWLHSASTIGLSWLQLLVQDREPQVRFAGLNLLASLSAVPTVIEPLLTSWGDRGPFGLWGACLNIALDPQETGLVRQQALLVLVNQSAAYTRSQCWDKYLTHNTPEVTLCGLGALQLLVETYSLLLSVQATVHDPSSTLTEVRTSREQQEDSGSSNLPAGRWNVPSEEAEVSLPASVANSRDLASFAGEIFRSCRPLVVSGMCRLLHNLLLAYPEFIGGHMQSHSILQALVRYLDAEVFRVFLLAGKLGSISSFVQSAWMRLFRDVVDLLRLGLEVRFEATAAQLLREGVVSSLCQNMAHIQSLQPHSKDCLAVGSSILALLQSMVERAPQGETDVFSALQLHWNSFTGLLSHSLGHASAIHLPLRKHGLKLLCLLLSHRFQPGKGGPGGRGGKSAMEALRILLDGNGEEEEKKEDVGKGGGLEQRETKTKLKVSSQSTGALLCDVLLKSYDGDTSTVVPGGALAGKEEGGRHAMAEDKGLITVALCLLLASSTTAKETALACGLLESTLEQVKSLHTLLCLESLDEPSPTIRKKKESSAVSQLYSALSLLRNFLCGSLEVKLAALESGLPSVIHKLWPCCTVERRLLLTVLKLLSVLTAQCSEGRSSLTASISKGGNTLMHSILKTASLSIGSYRSYVVGKATANPHSEVLRATFCLLSNSVLSPECRGILKKVGFLSEFLKVNPKSERLCHGHMGLSTMWMGLLANLSLSTDGQQMILKLPGSVDLLIDVYQSAGERDAKALSLLVLRNLCFYAPSKSLLASIDNFLRVFSVSLGSEDHKQVAMAASAVQALLHNCTKIKGCLRKSGLAEKLSHLDSLSKLTGSTGNNSEEHQWRNNVARALALLQ